MTAVPAALAFTWNVPVFFPPGIVIEDATAAVAGEVLDNEIFAPPEGAALFSVTVPFTTVPTGTSLPLSETLDRAAPVVAVMKTLIFIAPVTVLFTDVVA